MKVRLVSALLCLCMVCSFLPVRAATSTSMNAGGWYETIWAEIPNISSTQIKRVQYTGPVSGSLTGADFSYLVRDENGGVRIDIPALKAGAYTLTVTTDSGELTQGGIVVQAYDRSGYAHFGYTEGVGAYRDDGTLKPGAIVLYVTEENKNTVSVTAKDGTTVTGIGNILNSVGMDTGSGTNSKGGKANTNGDILRKLAKDGTPLVIRILGSVTAPAGLTAYDSVDYGGSVGDNGAMARMSGGKDITIEGIGIGATINGWGLHFICQTADYANGYGKSFEVRNLTFCNVPEDCVGMEGQQRDSELTAPVERCWIHHCAFYGPTIANPAESDKDGGDGACDFKRGQYFTNAYCYYEGYHKTNLVGSSDSSLQYHMTYHHNYWKNCESRGPLARQANIHMYNNIFEGQTSYCMNPRADAYIFSEYNLFVRCKNPVRVKQGAVKSYQDAFVDCTGDNHATVVTDKQTKVATNCKYSDFDTNANLSYIPSGDYLLHESIETMKQVVIAQAGPQGGSVNAELPDVGNGSGGENGEQPGGDIQIPAGSYVHNFTENGKESDFYSISGNLSTSKGSVTFDGLTLTQCLKIETATSISFTAPESGTLILVFGGSTAAAGKTIKIDGKKQTIGADHILKITVSAGSHTITKGDSINLFYMVYTSDSVAGGSHTHSYESVVTEPTCTEQGSVTHTCACGDSYTEKIPATGHSFSDWLTRPGGGAQNRWCEICGYEETEDLPECEHEDLSWSEVVFPTCTEDGHGATAICNDCACLVVAGEVLPATGHSYDEGVASGNCIVFTCQTCGYQMSETVETQPTEPTNPVTPTQPNPTEPATSQPAPREDPVEEVPPKRLTWLLPVLGMLLVVPIGITAWFVRKKKK